MVVHFVITEEPPYCFPQRCANVHPHQHGRKAPFLHILAGTCYLLGDGFFKKQIPGSRRKLLVQSPWGGACGFIMLTSYVGDFVQRIRGVR